MISTSAWFGLTGSVYIPGRCRIGDKSSRISMSSAVWALGFLAMDSFRAGRAAVWRDPKIVSYQRIRTCHPCAKRQAKLMGAARILPCDDQLAIFARMRGTRFGLIAGTCNAGI